MNRPAPFVSLLVAVCLLPAIASFRADAQPQTGVATASGTWALTGVRIADGSGNEPFEGTVVVRDGRIVEAGRSVRPPSDARVIDAHGRTVTTGLIDLQVQLPAGATDDQIDRALAAYAYAGVTTIAVSGLDPAKFDVVRERLQGKGLASPRLVAANPSAATGAPGLARTAPADQRKPTPFLSDFLPPSQVQRLQSDAGAGTGASAGASPSAGGGAGVAGGAGAVAGGSAAAGTAAPAGTGAASGASAGDAGRWQVAVDKVKALRASNARLGLASGAGEAGAGLPHGWSTLLEARLMAVAGLTPLQVMTAATSGGAWALSLQSDRAFIAVGQRADLVVFNGNPTSTIAEIERVERVFIGGQEVDRPALRALLTREDPLPPAPPAPTETTASANAKTSGAATATRGAAKGRGKRGAKTDPVAPAVDPPASSATGAAAGATPGATTGATGGAAGVTPGAPSSAAGAAGTPSSAAPSAAAPSGATPSGASSGAARSSATTSGATTSGATTSGATTNPVAAPPAGTTSPTSSASAAPSGGVPGAAPGASPAASSPSTSSSTGTSSNGTPPPSPAGAPSAAPATGGSRAAASASASAGATAATVEEPLIDDFETNGDRGNLGAAWQASGDPSTLPATIIAGRVVRGLRDHALHLTARMGDANQPFAGVTVRLASTPGQPVDVSRFRGIRFEARGEGRYRIVFVTRSVTDGRYHISYFSGSPLWTPVSIPFASLGQSHGTQLPFSGRDLIEISFQVARDPGQMGWLELDNLRFYQ